MLKIDMRFDPRTSDILSESPEEILDFPIDSTDTARVRNLWEFITSTSMGFIKGEEDGPSPCGIYESVNKAIAIAYELTRRDETKTIWTTKENKEKKRENEEEPTKDPFDF